MSKAWVRGAHAALLLLAASSGLHAQIEGRVTDGAGTPVALADVRLLAGGAVVATTLSDSTGRFHLVVQPGADAIRVSAMGMSSVDVPLGDLLHPLEVTLAPAPLELPGLEVASRAFACPGRDDPRARELWVRAMARYSPVDSGTFVTAWPIETRRLETWPGEAGETGAAPTRGTMGFRAGAHPFWNERSVRSGGYARRQTWSSFDGSTEAWEYLMARPSGSQMVAAPWFLELQTVGMVRDDDWGSVIAFCDAGRRLPGLQGQLHIDSEGWIRKVEWRSPTPEPMEHAGGELFYPPGSVHLLPDAMVFWRMTPLGKYWREAIRILGWSFAKPPALEELTQLPYPSG